MRPLQIGPRGLRDAGHVEVVAQVRDLDGPRDGIARRAVHEVHLALALPPGHGVSRGH